MMVLSIIIPAMLHITCSQRWRAVTCATKVAVAPGTDTSSSALSARPPVAKIALAVSAAVAAFTSAQTTRAPAPARTSAVLRPIPLPAPVTRATRPVRSNASCTLRAVSTGAP